MSNQSLGCRSRDHGVKQKGDQTAATNMEVSPNSFKPERYWTEEKERTLISFFSKNSCLWNHKLESYKNRQLRWKMLEHLRVLLSAQPPPAPFTVEDIKNKFKNLRTTFQRQYKAVKGSVVCGSDVFVPQWKYYQQLMFLQAAGLDDCTDAPLQSSLIVSQEESQHVLTTPGLIISILPPESPTTTTLSSSCILSNMVAKSFWTEEKECALIDFYAEHCCLWNKKSKNHNNRLLRLKLLKILRRQLSDHSASFSIEDIKCKFKNLRTVFNREYKVVQVSRTSDKLYHSKWKHYQRLLFLCEWCKNEERPDDLQILKLQEAQMLEHGKKLPFATPSSSSCSTQTNTSSTIRQTDAYTNTIGGFQIFSVASDYLKLQNQKTASTFLNSRSSSPLNCKPCTNNSPVKVPPSSPVQLECGLISDSRCQWNETKVHQLISFYSEHDCLWNYKSERYRNKLMKQSLLETLSSLLSNNEQHSFTVEDIKTKFRNLRTIFQREHKTVNSNKTCGSEDFYVPKWKHYRELMFLCESCDEEEQPKDVVFQQPADASIHPPDNQAPLASSSQQCQDSLETNNQTPNIMKMLESPPSPPPIDSQHSMPSSLSSTSSSHTDSGVLGQKRVNKPPPPATIEVLDFMKTFYQSQIMLPHAGFLKYVEECLNETPPDKVKRMKMKIIETIHNMSEEV
ncbi:uncharacterized protein LOC133413642 isoform X1 [Phycodurus eques]|uniref:uncharacterized protein LOC133413642 isoform X1 n=1 Tax=Phycodurus eques TaxID=693459 RepID=UPI002ACE9BB7|nr:uncharacterized protein LOC133413642 isoform X1 [Phycodurus eques]